MICFIKLQTQECTLDVMFNHDHRITEILVFTVKHESIFEATLPPFLFFPPQNRVLSLPLFKPLISPLSRILHSQTFVLFFTNEV